MNPKMKLLAGICIFGCISSNIAAVNNPKQSYCNEQKVVFDGPERIELHGDLLLSIGPDGVEVSVSDNAIHIQFNQSVGNVSIALYNAFEVMVYNNVVDTDVQQSVFIPINNAPSGTYSLELNTAVGNAEGTFAK